MTSGRLTVAATPIGNLGDISQRLVETLRTADLIYAEDTRRTRKLLAHIGIDRPMRSLFAGNEAARSAQLVEAVSNGNSVVLVTDAGMPTVSDPGARAVRDARAAGLEVTVVPGPSAVTTALALSGFGADRFSFEGFLPRKGQQRELVLESILAEDKPVVLFVSPNRVHDDLADLLRVLGANREIAIAREMSKLHEEVWVGELGAALVAWQGPIKGELTLVISAAPATAPSLEDALAAAKDRIAAGSTLSDAAREAAESTGVSRRLVYEALLDQ